MRSTSVTIAERQYTITELRARANTAWRKELDGVFGGIAGSIQAAMNTDTSNVQPMVQHIKSAISGVAGSVDEIKRLLYCYSPELSADQDWIEDNAYESDLLAVFVEVLKLAYPFGGAIQGIAGLMQAGQIPQPIKRS
jgi:hypothetical protein